MMEDSCVVSVCVVHHWTILTGQKAPSLGVGRFPHLYGWATNPSPVAAVGGRVAGTQV